METRRKDPTQANTHRQLTECERLAGKPVYQLDLFKKLVPPGELKPGGWNRVIEEIEMGRATRKLICETLDMVLRRYVEG